jgi:hypothetical protein
MRATANPVTDEEFIMIGQSLRRVLVLTGVATTLALAAPAAMAQAVASSAPGRPASAVAAASGSTSGSGAVSGTIPGTNEACTSNWKWYVAYGGADDYAQAEWTSNPCGFQMQVRAECSYQGGVGGSWAYSGIVKGTGIWDRAGCTPVITNITSAWQHFGYPGSSWSSWKKFWS